MWFTERRRGRAWSVARAPFLQVVLVLCMAAQQGGVAVASNGSQEATPVFRADTDLVLVRFQVAPARGKLIADLAPEDIEIREDGIARKVAHFQGGRLYPRTTPVEVHLLFDCSASIQGSGDLNPNVFDVSLLAEHENVSIGIWAFSGDLVCITKPTRDAARLRWAIQQVWSIPPRFTPLYLALETTIAAAAAAPGEAIREIAVISDGVPVRDSGTVDRAVRAAQNAGIALYPVLLTRTAPDSQDVSLTSNAEDAFKNIASPTGGRAFAIDPDASREHLLEMVLKRMAQEIRFDYVAGY